MLFLHTHTHTHTHTPSQSISASGLELVGMDVRLHGGTVVDTLSERVSHIIFSRRYVPLYKQIFTLCLQISS